MSSDANYEILAKTADGVSLRLKVVPNASRTRIAGVLGDRMKVSVAALPEAGKANQMVCELIAKVLRVPRRDVSVTQGQTQPQKTVEVLGLSLCQATEALDKVMR